MSTIREAATHMATDAYADTLAATPRRTEADAEHIAACRLAGYVAASKIGRRAPILYPEYRAAVADMPVGDPRTLAYAAAFQDGYQRVLDLECAALLADA